MGGIRIWPFCAPSVPRLCACWRAMPSRWMGCGMHTVVVVPNRSYLVCSVQRAGSWLLCQALQNTGVLGVPAEYFHPGDEAFWRHPWRAASEDAFLRALRQEPVTPNGVWGSKVMWNYFAAGVARLRAWPRLGLSPGTADPDVLAAASGQTSSAQATLSCCLARPWGGNTVTGQGVVRITIIAARACWSS